MDKPGVAGNPKGLERAFLRAKLGHQARHIKDVGGRFRNSVVGSEKGGRRVTSKCWFTH